MGGHGILCPPTWKKGGHILRVPHQIAPMDITNSQVDVETEFGMVSLDSVSLSILVSIKWYLPFSKFLETAKDV